MIDHSAALERFDPDDPAWASRQRELHISRYQFAAGFVAGKAVLDIACGSGFGVQILADSARSVLGVDRDPTVIERARSRFASPNAAFEVHDAEELQLHRTFDVVVSFETIEHLERPNRFLAALPLLLADKGHFLVSSPVRATGHLNDRPKNPFHFREWSEAEFRSMLETYFRKVEMFTQWTEYLRGPIPLARTVKSWIAAAMQPSSIARIHNAWPKPLDPPLPFKSRSAYMVAVCSDLQPECRY